MIRVACTEISSTPRKSLLSLRRNFATCLKVCPRALGLSQLLRIRKAYTHCSMRSTSLARP